MAMFRCGGGASAPAITNFLPVSSGGTYTFSKAAAGFLIRFQNTGLDTIALNGVNIRNELTGPKSGDLLSNAAYQYIGEIKAGDVLTATIGGFQMQMIIAEVE